MTKGHLYEMCANTDTELWRETPGDYYSDSIYVTKDAGIGINVGGYVIVAPVRRWHELGKKFLYVNMDSKIKKWKYGLAMWLLK
jgi:hypothetical protein